MILFLGPERTEDRRDERLPSMHEGVFHKVLISGSCGRFEKCSTCSNDDSQKLK